jgi:hypothetical protein
VCRYDCNACKQVACDAEGVHEFNLGAWQYYFHVCYSTGLLYSVRLLDVMFNWQINYSIWSI